MGQATYSYGGAMNYWAGYLFLWWGHELLGRLPIPMGGHELLGRLPIPMGAMNYGAGYLFLWGC